MSEIICTSLGYDQLHIDPGEEVSCPTCGQKLIILKNRIALLYLVPIEVLEEYPQDRETNEEDFGYIAAVCEKCGFNVTTEEKYTELEFGERFTAFLSNVQTQGGEN